MAGGGIRAANAEKYMSKLVDNFNIPVVSAYNGHDLFFEKSEKYIGRCGTQGDRRGNLAVECADLIIAIGTSLNIRQIGYNYGDFASDKFLCYIDVDPEELDKKTIKKNVNLPINVDIKYFLNKFTKEYKNHSEIHSEFLNWAKKVKLNIQQRMKFIRIQKINPYKFVMELAKNTKSSDTFVTSNAMSAVAPMVAMPLKKGQGFW